MRLPTLTAEQAGNEDARAFHEALWGQYLGVQQVFVPIGEQACGEVMRRVASNHKNFWLRRGYRLRQAQTADRTGVHVWLEALEPQKAIA